MRNSSSTVTAGRFLTTANVAEHLSVSVDQVVSLIRSRRLAAVNVAVGTKKPRWRISPEALESFLTARTPAPPPARQPRRKRSRETVTQFF